MNENPYIQNDRRFIDSSFHVIGNGPSLRNLDPMSLGKNILLCNRFCLEYNKYEELEYRAYFLVDPLYSERFSDYSAPIIEKLCQRNSRTQASFITLDKVALEIKKRSKLKLDLERSGLILQSFAYQSTELPLQVDFKKPISRLGQNVINIMILFAINLGATTIFLHGIDHDILAFTKDEYEADCDIPHFYPEKSPKQSFKWRWEERGLTWNDLEIAKATMLRQYEIIRALAIDRGIRILNACPVSQLKVFDFDS